MTCEPQTIWRPSSTGVSQHSRLSIQVRCPGSRAFHQRSMPIPLGEATSQSDANLSLTSPAEFKITPAKVRPSQFGPHLEVTRAPHLSAKSQCGEPPTASILETHDQPEAPNSKRSWPCASNASTGISRVPRSPQQIPGPKSDRPHAPHFAATTTSSARTRPLNGDPAGRLRPADNTPAVRSQRSEHQNAIHAAMAGQAAHSRICAFRSSGRSARRAARVLAPLRAAAALLQV
jgi:hypothetical protein